MAIFSCTLGNYYLTVDSETLKHTAHRVGPRRHHWSFNPYREVDEIADKDSDYTDADAELDWDIRNDPDYDSHTYVEDE